MVKKIIGIVLIAMVLISVVGHTIEGTLFDNVELIVGYVLFLVGGIFLIMPTKKNKQ